MKFSEVCIRYPVFTIVMSILIVIVGLIGYSRLPVSGYPKIATPEIGIHTTLSGASATYMQEQVSDVIESAVSTITGVDDVESNSQDGVSDVIIRFVPGVDLNSKMNEISNMVAKTTSQLPNGIVGPDINQADPNATPILSLFFYSNSMTITQLTDYINRYILTRLRKVEGVAQVPLFGNKEYAIRVWLRPQKMATLQVTVNDLIGAISSQNTLSTSGEIKSKDRVYPLMPQAKISDLLGFENIVVSHYQGKNIHLKDVADIKLGTNENTTASFMNGKKGVGINIIASSTANPITVANNVDNVLDQLRLSLPDNIHFKVGFNATKFLNKSIETTYETLIIAIILVILVVVIFIGSIKASLIPIITLPICLIGSFIFLYWMGFSLNILTLLSLILAVGLIVDDAIVILENIHRHIHLGLTPFEAAIKGSKEIGFAIIVITLTLAAVFAPIGFSEGLTGQLFWQFACTIVIAVLLSGFVAITLSPMMCAYILDENKSNKYSLWFNHYFDRFITMYSNKLAIWVSYKKTILAIFMLLIGLGLLITYALPKELAPEVDQGNITIPFNAVPNASFDYMKFHALEISNALSKTAEKENIIINLGQPNRYQGNANLVLKPWSERSKSQSEISNQLQSKVQNIPGITAAVAPPPPMGIGGQGGFAMELILVSQGSFEYLYHVAQTLMEKMKSNHGFKDIQTNIQFNELEYSVKLNRSLAADLGVNISDISSTLGIFTGNYLAGEFYYDNYPYDILLSSNFSNINSLKQLQMIYVKTSSGNMVPISSFIKPKMTVLPTVLSNYNQMHALHVMANLSENYSTSDAVDYMQSLLSKVLPDDVSYVWFGQTKNYLESANSMLQNLILALIFIYLLLSAQFGSFRQPLIILTTVPAALAGAVLFLYITGSSLNIFSQIGLIALVGLITKHGILITEFANQLLEKGQNKVDAIINASKARVKPILMTTAAMILGALPLVLDSGPGSEYGKQIGIVIIGGLMIGTCVTLFIVPVFYLLISKIDN
ncbi:MAG: efflux RND transporter permease subunit [Gammaproteobacteria bacterium]|nr:MAG: efflux RND transporter permease subunit [Gammaproteobacteria bacterium]UTW43696.1 efflux RND transporter permease subunit [bacterium SCSIO 12844]